MPRFEPKTVAEQTAFEFGSQLRQSLDITHRKDERALSLVARKYAFTHQFQFQRATDGYGRALAAFCAGAGLDLNKV
jgi:hypothetical protein